MSEADLSSGPGGRLSYRLADGSFHGLLQLLGTTTTPTGTEYTVATDEPGRTAKVDVDRTPTGLRVSLGLQPDGGVTDTFEAFSATSHERFLGGGERPQALDLNGQALAVKVSYDCQNTMPAPFFLSSAGYGVSLRETAVAALGFPGATPSDACPGGAEPRCPLAQGLDVVQLCVKSATLAYDLFAGTPEQIVSAYTRTTGRPQLPPPSQFALIKWRDAVSGPAQLYEDVDKLHALHVPIGWILLDNPWESAGCYGTMTFDTAYADPRGMIRALHKRGVRFMLWISPLVRRQYCPPPAQYSQFSLFGTGNAATIDLTNPAVVSTFESSLRTLIGMGVDGFKADRGDEIDLESEQLAGGSGVTLHNLYPLLYAKAVAAAVKASGKSGTFATLFRSGAPGSAATVPGFWAGDQAGTFGGLVDAIHDGLSAGTAGYAVWGSDTGGYGATASGEVLVRWAQFSAVSPVFEVGGTGENSTFWDYGTPIVNAFRDAAVLHYELFPYLYELARVAHSTGLPILRPLALEYPDDSRAWRADTEALVGPDLLAAPVTEAAPAGSGGTTPTPVYLPAGSWLDLATGLVHHGGSAPFSRPTPLDQLPLYLRAGAAIPFAARTPLIWAKPWPTDALQLPRRGGWIYAPAPGSSSARAQGFGTLSASTRGRTITLRLRGAPSETQVLVAGALAARTVSIDGRLVARASSAARLRQARGGWVQARTPFPGLVLKLAPRAGVASVVLTLR